MGWLFRLNPLLAELNAQRAELGKTPLAWGELAPLLGMSRQSLQNLASNRELKVTNTRFLEAFCRFFGKEIHEVISLDPPLEFAGVDQDEVDRRLVPRPDFQPDDRFQFHVEELYSDEMSREWRQMRADQDSGSG